ncbi:beta-ketoacyl synthase N-terminal-like domain-containing protein [Streptomyces sp. G45]|uniref:beta-ketoacyl synthase N-terminal-like domain-containing protein n=1 Tax=Streptomyces sp. G45 TaxID=3406627 RepID=UPI003C244139
MRSVSSGAVALVGVGLRLPGGISSLDGLWAALIEGRDLVSDTPPDRFDRGAFGDPGGRAGRTYTTAGAFLEDVASFDAAFFGMSPKETSRVDPQHRLVLECAVEALGDAAIAPEALAGSDAGVFVGISTHDYGDLQMRRPKEYNAYTMAGAALCNVANRISYFLDLHGPSLAIDTACSSTLTAVHEACEAVRSGRSAVALAGGVNVILSPYGYLGGSAASMLSPTGRCHPFSALADGFVRAEGAGVFVLKPLAAALADGDRVHAVIAGSAANSDGRTAGLSMPSPRAQRQLLERVYAASGVNPRDVSYVEAHGTGTRAGDPVECAALGAVLGRGRSLPLPVGSVKSNVGHLEAGAGVAGLAKALLVLREGTVPRTLHSQPLSEEIDFAGLGLAPVVEPVRLEGPRVVGVNSFGFGGANAHVVVTAPEPVEAADTGAGADGSAAVPVVVWGRGEAAVARAADELADFLSGPEAPRWADVAYSSVRRAGRGHRCVVFADGPGVAAARLRALAAGLETAATGATASATAAASAAGKTVPTGRTGFVFSGNGSVWEGMGTALARCAPLPHHRSPAPLGRLTAQHLVWEGDLVDASVRARPRCATATGVAPCVRVHNRKETGMGGTASVPLAPGAVPLLGHVPALLRDPLRFVASLPACGDLVRLQLGTRPLVMVCDPGLTRRMLLDDRVFDKGGPLYERLRDVLGNGLGTCPTACTGGSGACASPPSARSGCPPTRLRWRRTPRPRWSPGATAMSSTYQGR